VAIDLGPVAAEQPLVDEQPAAEQGGGEQPGGDEAAVAPIRRGEQTEGLQ
jgi:hypothetical protein